MINKQKDTMKVIKYKDKEYKLPFKVLLSNEPTKEGTVANRFGGDTCTLPEFAIAVYDVIMGAEMLKDWKTHRQGLDWFSRNFTDAYYKLLD